MRLIRLLVAYVAMALLVVAFSPSGVGQAAPAVTVIHRAVSAKNRQHKHRAAQALGSSCQHPLVVVAKPHEPEAKVLPHFTLGGEGPNTVSWMVTSNYVVCSARVQLQGGAWVKPTSLWPFATPTPTGGEYVETGDPKSRFRQIVVKYAKSAVTRGSSCDYPLGSNGLHSAAGDNKDFGVNWKPNTPTLDQYEFDVVIHNPQIVICRAVAWEMEDSKHPGVPDTYRRAYHPTVGPHGGISSPLPAPKLDGWLLVWVYARLR